jgi:hypothetical protein
VRFHRSVSVSGRVDPGDFDRAVVKRGSRAHIGQLLAGQLVDVGAGQPQLAPPHTQAVDHAGAGASGNHGLAKVGTTGVEDTHHVAGWMARAWASLRCISTSGSPSLSRRLFTLTKLEFKKLRAGGEIMASG